MRSVSRPEDFCNPVVTLVGGPGPWVGKYLTAHLGAAAGWAPGGLGFEIQESTPKRRDEEAISMFLVFLLVQKNNQIEKIFLVFTFLMVSSFLLFLWFLVFSFLS